MKQTSLPRPGTGTTTPRSGTGTTTPRPGTGTTTQVIAFTITRVILNTLHRMVYPFLAVLARGVGVDIISMSYALTARSLVGTVGPFAATVADRRGRRFGMLLGIGLFTLGTAIVVFWPTFPALVLSIILSTLGKYIFDPSMQAYLADRIPYARRGRTMAVTEFGWSLAFILGIPLMGFLIARNGWMAPFPLMVILGALIFAGLFVMLPKDEKPAAENRSSDTFKVILTSVPALAGLAVGLLASAGNEVVNLIFGVWLEDAFGLQIAALGAASAVIGLSELGGEGLVAAFVDRLGKVRAIGLGLAANCLAALALLFLGRTQAGALVGLFFFYLTFEFTLVSIIPLMTELLPSARATLMAFNVAALSLGRALGDLLAPRLYGLGFWFIVLGAVGFNLLALAALRKVKMAT
ncbi:MAG: MFS transporter [Candidatus Atribacteria bacterium]|nr:MFS transporter [Candidatus Atribacteria bacterium]